MKVRPPSATTSRALLGGLAAALCLSACGMLGAPSFQEERPANGISPWDDLGAVSFCAAGLRLAPPSAQPEGVCVSDAAPPPVACSSDAGCGSRQQCVCGACVAAYCGSNADCSPGRTCDPTASQCFVVCTTSAGCTSGETCASGLCRKRCSLDGQCQYGERCNGFDGTCELLACATDADCGAGTGRRCALQQTPWDVREPSAVTLPVGPGGASRVVLFFEQRVQPGGVGPVAKSIYRAVADDATGQSFHLDPATALLSPQPSDAGELGAPSAAVAADGRIRLAAAVGDDAGIVLYTASDAGGASFTRGAGVLTPDRPWEAGHVGSPGLAAAPAGSGAPALALVYVAGRQAALGAARSADGITWSKLPQPVLTPGTASDPVLWRDVDALDGPALRLDRDPAGNLLYRVWFSGHGVEAADAIVSGSVQATPPDWAVGYAAGATLDGLVPYPFEPVFVRVQLFIDHQSELAPDELPSPAAPGAEELLYYGAASYDETGNLVHANVGVAVNPPRLR